jgi:hypothetical protein
MFLVASGTMILALILLLLMEEKVLQGGPARENASAVGSE